MAKHSKSWPNSIATSCTNTSSSSKGNKVGQFPSNPSPVLTGNRGPAGENGRPGRDGLPGEAGLSALFHGYFVTRHSQTDTVPECPFGMRRLWAGYSLLFMQGNERGHGQDLGRNLILVEIAYPIVRSDIYCLCCRNI